MVDIGKDAVVFVLGVMATLAFAFGLGTAAINKFGDQQGGLSEKNIMGGIAAGVMLTAAAAIVAATNMNFQVG